MSSRDGIRVEIEARPATFELSPRSAAVIVVDMQHDFASPDGMFDRAGIPLDGIRAVVEPERAEYSSVLCFWANSTLAWCRYRAAVMVLFAPLARLVLTRLRWLFATGDERDAEILACGAETHPGVLTRGFALCFAAETARRAGPNHGDAGRALTPDERSNPLRYASLDGPARLNLIPNFIPSFGSRVDRRASSFLYPSRWSSDRAKHIAGTKPHRAIAVF